MKLVDEKGRLFGKINIFDLIVLIALILVVAAVGYKIVKDRQESAGQTPTKPYIVTVKAPAMPDTFAEALQKDNRIYYDSDGFTNARIIDVKEVPAVITIQTDDGRLVETESPSLKDVYVQFEVNDKMTEPDIRVARISVQVGAKFPLKTIYALSSDSIVLDIKEK